MGLSFHYSGKLKSAGKLPFLVEEVADICDVLNWKTTIFKTEYTNNRFIKPINNEDYGIVFNPPECEPVLLVFDSAGYLYVPWLKEILNKNENGEIKVITLQINLSKDGLEPIVSENNDGFDINQMVYQVHVKTQQAGAETHMKVIELLKYLSSKYLKNFKLIDDSQYFETGDVSLLDDKINLIQDFIDSFTELLNKSKIESPNDFLRILKKMSSKNKKNRDNIEDQNSNSE